MRCKKHLSDLSSCTGVCATCLRDRLLPLAAAAADHLRSPSPLVDHRIIPHNIPPPSLPPHTASLHVASREFDSAAVTHRALSDQRFHSTLPAGTTTGGENSKKSKWTLLSNLFRSAARFSSTVSGRRRKQSRLFSVDESNSGVAQSPCRDRGFPMHKGMSPERYANGNAEGGCRDGSAGESPEGWKETPTRATPARRRPGHVRNFSGMVICLSPLVRASPSRHWNQKGIPPDMAVTGEIRGVKPHLAHAASFHANKSRKIADFGRFNLHR